MLLSHNCENIDVDYGDNNQENNEENKNHISDVLLRPEILLQDDLKFWEKYLSYLQPEAYDKYTILKIVKEFAS